MRIGKPRWSIIRQVVIDVLATAAVGAQRELGLLKLARGVGLAVSCTPRRGHLDNCRADSTV